MFKKCQNSAKLVASNCCSKVVAPEAPLAKRYDESLMLSASFSDSSNKADQGSMGRTEPPDVGLPRP
jgi:hypothetical protein